MLKTKSTYTCRADSVGLNKGSLLKSTLFNVHVTEAGYMLRKHAEHIRKMMMPEITTTTLDTRIKHLICLFTKD